jgi:class IIb bacteriocin, lactobin A/cerein 7B family
MKELKLNELKQVSGGFDPVSTGIGILVAGASILISAGYSDGRSDRRR